MKCACMGTIFLLVCSVSVMAAPVPNTGQTKCYDDTGEILCPEPGEPFYGQDAQYGTNLHSYTDLGNGIVRDNVTGLEWQQATAPGIYTWQQALYYCDALYLGGHDDWRLPTIHELDTLVDSSIPYPGPTIDTAFFPGSVASGYWSSTSFASDTSYVAWYVDFGYGRVSSYFKTSEGYVRAVRSGQPIVNNFVDNGDGTVTDNDTGLMWQQATAAETKTWEQALTYCENLALAGHSDWRLPNRNELRSIVDYSTYNPSIDTIYFPGTVASNYWSSTTDADDTNYALYVIFGLGSVGSSFKTNGLYVRAVRSGQCGPFGDSDGDGICDDGDVSGIVGDNPCVGGNIVFCDDNCPDDANADQTDSDSDGIGDACDECTIFDISAQDAKNMIEANPDLVVVDVREEEEYCDDIGGDSDGVGHIPGALNYPLISGVLEQDYADLPLDSPILFVCRSGNRSSAASEFLCSQGYTDIYNMFEGMLAWAWDRDTCIQTLIDLSSLEALASFGKVTIQWATVSEIDNAGFNIYRSTSENGDYIKVNDDLISADGSATEGSSYEYVDEDVRNRMTYWCKLEDIDLNGTSTMHGPVSATPRLMHGIGK